MTSTKESLYKLVLVPLLELIQHGFIEEPSYNLSNSAYGDRCQQKTVCDIFRDLKAAYWLYFRNDRIVIRIRQFDKDRTWFDECDTIPEDIDIEDFTFDVQYIYLRMNDVREIWMDRTTLYIKIGGELSDISIPLERIYRVKIGEN